jgi:hypothetical protein
MAVCKVEQAAYIPKTSSTALKRSKRTELIKAATCCTADNNSKREPLPDVGWIVFTPKIYIYLGTE